MTKTAKIRFRCETVARKWSIDTHAKIGSQTRYRFVRRRRPPAILNEDSFWPAEPRTMEEAGIPESLCESLICLQLLNAGTLSGRNLSEKIGLPFALVELQLASMRMRQMITHARPAPLNDFYYSLTENGQKRAVTHQKNCSYAAGSCSFGRLCIECRSSGESLRPDHGIAA